MLKHTAAILRIYGLPLLILITVFGLISLIVQPWTEYLAMDDWINATPVRSLMETGQITFIEWSTHYFFTLIFWGALFCLPFGFSFGALHVSILVMAVIGLWAFYGILRELEIGVWSAWLGVFLMGFLPPFFLLSNSFMDEVPFWALMNVCSYYYLIGQKRQKESLVWWGVFFNLLAFFIKIYAVVAIIALLIYRLTHRKRLYFDFSDLLPILGFGIFAGIGYHFCTLVYGMEIASMPKPDIFYEYYAGYFSDILYRLMNALLNISILLSPLTLAIFDWRKLRGYIYAGLVLAALCILCFFLQNAFPDPLPRFNVFNLWELGQSRIYIAGSFDPRVVPLWINPLVFGLSLFSASILSSVFLGTINEYRKLISDVHLIIYLQAVLLVVLMILFWQFSDHFYIFLFPALIVMILDYKKLKIHRLLIGAMLTILWLMISITGTLDHIAHQKTLARAYSYLMDGGTNPKIVDAGYTINGWYAYANLRFPSKNAERIKQVHAVTPVDDRAYWMLSKSALPGYNLWRTYKPEYNFWATSSEVDLFYFNYALPDKKKKKNKKSAKKSR